MTNSDAKPYRTMLEILLIYFACSNLSTGAKNRGHSGAVYCGVFIAIYLGLLVAGAVLAGLWDIPPIAGAYLLGLPGAFLAYFCLNAGINKLPILEGSPMKPQQMKPVGDPITFSCAKCGAVVNSFSGMSCLLYTSDAADE